MALSDDLVSYWALNEASGNALDSHGSNDLTDVNTVGSTTGKINNARQFVRANSEYLNIATNASLALGDIDFTVSAWVYLDSTGVNVEAVGKWTPTGSQREFRLGRAGAGAWRLGVTANGSSEVTAVDTAIGVPSTSTWYHLVAWHDSVANQIGISVNANTANTTSHSTGVFNGSGDFSIGRIQTGGFFFDGRIDEVGFWKRVLTSQERTDLYNGGAGLAYPFSGGGGPTSWIRSPFVNRVFRSPVIRGVRC